MWFRRCPGVGAWNPTALGGKALSTGVTGSGSVLGSISCDASSRSMRSDASPLSPPLTEAGEWSARSPGEQSLGLSGSENTSFFGDSTCARAREGAA